MIHLPVLILTLSLLAFACRAEERAVLLADHSTVAEDGQKSVTLHMGETVQVVKRTRAQSRVKGVRRDLGVAWVPNEKLAVSRDFAKSRHWKGESAPEVLAGDFSADYKIQEDGSFRLFVPDPDHVGKGWRKRGHLYVRGDIVWARLQGTRPLTPEDIFIAKPDGTLCWSLYGESCRNSP